MRSTVMTLNTDQYVQLPKNQTLTIDAGEVTISCLSGTVWITWAGGREKCLNQGDSLVIQSHIKICIQAFTASRIRLLGPQRGGLGMQHYILSNLNRLRRAGIGFVQ